MILSEEEIAIAKVEKLLGIAPYIKAVRVEFPTFVQSEVTLIAVNEFLERRFDIIERANELCSLSS